MNTGGDGLLTSPPLSSDFPRIPHSFHNAFHNVDSPTDGLLWDLDPSL